MRKIAALLATTLVLISCGGSPAQETGQSYLINDGVSMFCGGGRFLLKVVDGRMHLWCEVEPVGPRLTIVGGDRPKFIVGITIEDNSLEAISRK